MGELNVVIMDSYFKHTHTHTHTQKVNSAGILELITSCNIAEFVFKKRITATFKKYLLNKSSF